MKKITTLLAYGFLIIMAFITLFPFIYMILSSLMTAQEAAGIPPTLIPKAFQWGNYAEALRHAPFVRYFINTVFVSCLTTIGVLITTVLASFAFVKLQFKGKKIILMVFISLLMVPYESIIFTNYRTIAQLNLLDTYIGLIIPFIASIFYIFYLNQYLSSIPDSYYQAAKIDGCSDLEFIRKVLIPLAKPALMTIAILSFVASWNSFLWPLLVTNNTSMRLLNNGLSAFATEAGSQVELQMAAATITIVPVLILYFFFRKEIIKGVSRNGLKG